MLRDTGAMKSFIVATALTVSERTFCGSHVLVRGLENEHYESSFASDSSEVRFVFRTCESWSS